MEDTGVITESVPVEAPPTPGGSEGTDDSSLSPDQIIDKYADLGRTTEEAPAAEPQAAAPDRATEQAAEAQPEATQAKPDETQQAQEGKEEETPEPLLAEPEPEDLKKAFKSLAKWHPDVAKSVRNAFYEAKAYKEIFTVPEAREFRQLFNTVQDAKEARAGMADLLAADHVLRNDPPALFQWLAQKDPNSFKNLALAAPAALYQADPAAYRENISIPAVRRYHDVLSARAQQEGNVQVSDAIQILQEFERQISQGAAPSGAQATQGQADPAMVARLRELEAKEAQATNQAITTFQDAVDSDLNDAVFAEVDRMVGVTGADLTEAARKEVGERVLSDVKDALSGDQILQARLRASVNGGARDAAHRKQLGEQLVANAKRFLAPSFRSHIEWMTKEIIRADAGNGKSKAVSPPVRSVGGASAPGPRPAVQPTQADFDKMTPDEIFKWAAANPGR